MNTSTNNTQSQIEALRIYLEELRELNHGLRLTNEETM